MKVTMDRRDVDGLLGRIDAYNAQVGAAQRAMLALIAALEDPEHPRDWECYGARDLPHLLCIRYQVSWWKAERWVGTARALEHLPEMGRALEQGQISLDKVLELCRFATPADETRLLRWATGVSCTTIRRHADLEARRSREDVEQLQRERSLTWWFYDRGTRFFLEACLPAAEGAVVAGAIERLAATVPVLPGEEGRWYVGARRADALVALCSSGGTRSVRSERSTGPVSAPGVEPPTVVIHAPVEVLGSADRSAQVNVEGHLRGGIVHAETIRRLTCTARIQVVAEDEHGNAVAMGRTTRVPSASMLRQLRYRDAECRFPGCGARRFTQAHHVRWWSQGGRTDLDNLVLVCSFHHTLAHEHGWSLVREPDNTVRWYRPDGTRYRAGPAPPPVMEPPDGLIEGLIELERTERLGPLPVEVLTAVRAGRRPELALAGG